MVSKELRSRLVWLIIPLGGYLLLVWVFHPANAEPSVLQRRMLAGFLFGLCYGLFLWRDALLMNMFESFKASDVLKNYWPNSFYLGREKAPPSPVMVAENEEVATDE
jgi:hypothetical protein